VKQLLRKIVATIHTFHTCKDFHQELTILLRDASCTGTAHVRTFVGLPEHFSEGLSEAILNGKWGYVDRERKVVILFQFDHAHPFESGVAMVVLNKKTFFINRPGQRITPLFDWAFDFHDGLAAVGVADKVGYIRRDGSFAIPPIHHSASGIDFAQGLVAIRVKGKVGFMDRSGKIVIQPKYDDVYAFSDGLAPVELGGKWGHVDKSGKLAIPVQYQFVHMFSEGVASVALDGKSHYIKPDGSAAFPATFDSAMPFCGGVASVETFHITEPPPDPRLRACRTTWVKGKHGVIDCEGNYLWRDVEEQTWHGVCN
jgi:WG repeat protein